MTTTATQTKNSKKSDESDPITLPVQFGKVGFGDETASISFAVSRDHLELDTADNILCARRFNCKIILQPKDDDQAQQYMVDGLRLEVAGSADTTQTSWNRKYIKCGLTFSLSDVEDSELWKFSKKQGRLEISDVDEIPKKTGRNKAGTPATDETNWRDHKIDELRGVTDHDLTTLKAVGILTMGDLEEARKVNRTFQNIKGIGDKAGERILESVLGWLQEHRGAMDADDGGPLDDEEDEDDEDDE